MKKLSEKNIRRLTIAGLGVVCVALVIAISSQFHAEKPKDNTAALSPKVSDEINVKPETDKIADQTDVIVSASKPSASSSQGSGSGVSSGTKQTIQSDVSKPEAPKETPKPQGDTNNQNKAPAYNSKDTMVSEPAQPKGGEKKDGKIYVPGFGWVENHGGGGEGTTVDGGGDINKQVGNMN